MQSPSADGSFTPRREFLREQKNPPNAFALLAISSSSLVRLYSFPQPVISAVRRLFETRLLLSGFKEDSNLNFCEFSLHGKPWANPKAVLTEALLLEIISVIYQQGHSFSSTIDYGREQDDKLCIVFHKQHPVAPSTSPTSASRSASPMSASTSTSTRRVPFALSFPSATSLRVISPPLHSTPAILQAVRAAWPRGVVSETKLRDVAFEFKLKGYNWFQEDTFATDSLSYILSLLSSLDSHSFSLVTSISLTGRSRVKDLWIFTGPAPSSTDQLIDTPPPSLSNSPRLGLFASEQSSHHRYATAPNPSITAVAHSPPHARATTEDTTKQCLRSSPVPNVLPSEPSLLRKPAPRAQVPVSVVDNDEFEEGAEGEQNDVQQETVSDGQQFRANLPGFVPPDVQDMTGVGTPSKTPDVFYATSPLGEQPSAWNIEAEKAAFPDAYTSPDSVPHPVIVTPPLEPIISPPGLLSPGAFGDSDSHTGEDSPDTNLPIMWDTPVQGSNILDEPEGKQQQQPHIHPDMPHRSSSGVPMLPGAWTATPMDEKPDPTPDVQGPGLPMIMPVRDVHQRVASPELKHVHSDDARKSEAGILEMASSSPTSDIPAAGTDQKENISSPSSSTQGQGWVIVDVEGKRADADKSAQQAPNGQVTSEDTSRASPSSPKLAEQSSMSAAAKTIAIIDAVDASKKDKTPSPSPSVSADSLRSEKSGVRRFFSLRKKSKEGTPRKRVGSDFQTKLAKVGE